MSGFVLSVSYVFQNVFKQHHRDRFNILLGKTVDLKGIGYNTNQSEIAIGSEAGLGKVLKGPKWLPEQHTDYIFTTVGEEWEVFFSSNCFICWLFLRVIYLSDDKKQSSVEFMAIALLVFYLPISLWTLQWLLVFSNNWCSTTILFLWWVWLVGIYYFTVYIPENGCQ
jgi:cell division protein FtsW (lipid II flippase)